MAVSNTLGNVAGLAGLGRMVSNGSGTPGFAASALGLTGGTPANLKTDHAGAPLSPADARLVDAEMGVLGAIQDVPRWLQEERQKIQFQNDRFQMALADIRMRMPPLGTKPTDAVLHALHNDLGQIMEASGSNPSSNVLALEDTIGDYISAAEQESPAASSPEEPSAPQAQESAPENSGGLLTAIVGKMVATKVTSGGYAKTPKTGGIKLGGPPRGPHGKPTHRI